MNPLEEAIEFLERLQECQKRPTNYGSIDAQELINGQLDCVIEELKQFQIDLQTKNDHSCNCSHCKVIYKNFLRSQYHIF